MKKFVLATGLVCAALSSSAFAQSEKYAGFQLGGGLNIVSGRVDVSYNNSGNATSNIPTSGNASVFAQYNFALNSNWIAGLGTNLQVGDTKAGAWIDAKDTLKNVYSVYGILGRSVNENDLIYAKLGYGSGDIVDEYASTTSSVETKYTKTLTSRGLGFGYQGFIAKDLIFSSELMYTSYQEFVSTPANRAWTPVTTTISFTVSRKF